MDFKAHATASLGKTSHSSILRQNIFLSPYPVLQRNLQVPVAAAMHMSSVIVFALTSKTPRKMAGNPRLLLTWLGKSLRPVATTRAPASSASHGQISGIGLAQAKTMESFAMVFIHSFFMVPGPGFEAATTASTPLKASAMSPVLPSALVFWVTSYFHGSSSLVYVWSALVDDAFAVSKNNVAWFNAPLHKHISGSDVCCA